MIIGGYIFKGPFASSDEIEDQVGIYTIICEANGKFYLIDIGESNKVRSKIDNYDKKKSLEKVFKRKFIYFVCYTPELEQSRRTAIKQSILEQSEIPFKYIILH